MTKQNPRTGQGARVWNVHCGGHSDLTRNRKKIKANEHMRVRLAALLWGFPWTSEVRRG